MTNTAIPADTPESAISEPRQRLSLWRSLLAGLFLLSVVGKLATPKATLVVLTSVWHFAPPTAQFLFVLLVMAETALSALLVLRRGSLPVWIAAAFLLLVSASIVRQIAGGSELGCGCGLPGGVKSFRLNQWIGITRNLVLLLVCWMALRRGDVPRYHPAVR
jgi:hypothetical protein